jgi:hypothetical protein
MNLFRNIKKNYVIITVLIFIILASTIQYTKLFSIIEGAVTQNKKNASVANIAGIVVGCIFGFILLGLICWSMYSGYIMWLKENPPVQNQVQSDYNSNTNANNRIEASAAIARTNPRNNNRR